MIDFFSPEKILLVVAVGLLFMGPKRLPAIGRWVGRTLKELQKGASGLSDELKAGLTAPVAADATKE